MRVVHKYRLEGGVNRIHTHQGGKVLLVGTQGAFRCIWIELDPDAPLVTRCFYLVGTGQPFGESGADWFAAHVGSFQDGVLVWHVYEQVAKAPVIPEYKE